MRKVAWIMGAALLLASCSDSIKDFVFPEDEETTYEVIATWETNGETRSRIQSGETSNRVLWTKGDEFVMLGWNAKYNSFKAVYFTTQEDGKESATFSTTVTNGLKDYSPCYSLYPSKNARYYYNNGAILSAPVYPTQKAVAGGVEEGVNISTAYSVYWLDNLSFQNVLTYVRFRLSGKAVGNLESITFDAGKTIAGDISIRWVDGEPVTNFERYWNPITAERSTSITLTGPFVEGQEYYIAMAPVDLEGFNMVFTDKDGKTLFKHSNKQLSMERSVAYDFGTIDIGDKFEDDDYEVIKYMKQTRGSKPVDLCIISEGFTKDEMGLFESLAKSATDYLFQTEPFKTYKDYFNVYFLTAPSYESGASVTDGNGTVIDGKTTYFNARWGETNSSDMQADDSKVYSFVSQQCPEIADGTLTIQDVPILMIINDPRYAGVTRSSEDGRGYSMVPYTRDENGNVKSLMWSYPSVVPLKDEPISGASVAPNFMRPLSDSILKEVGGFSYGDWRNVVLHEFGGHCFARFADEYWSSAKYTEYEMASHSWMVPFGLNLADDYSNVAWQKDLLDNQATLAGQDPHYERIGKYQGGDSYMFGRWRAERVSGMTDNRRYFSAWQRILIVKRILEKAGQTFSLEAFFAADVTTDPMRDETSSGTPGIDIENAEKVDVLPSPVFTDAN